MKYQMKSSFRSVRPKTVQMMKNDKNGRTGSVNCFKMRCKRRVERRNRIDCGTTNERTRQTRQKMGKHIGSTADEHCL